MKKSIFFMVILAVLAVGCKKNENKSEELNYNDSDPIVMALSGVAHNQNPAHCFDHKIQAKSDYDITYTTINPDDIEIITVTNDGYINGKNVGEAKVRLDNGYETKTVDVIVKLFIEPTFEFGCNTDRIKELFGNPYLARYTNDTTLLYNYSHNDARGYYSYTCGEMDFFFHNGIYTEADLYIKESFYDMLEEYLDNNFDFDTIVNSKKYYKYKPDHSIRCGLFSTNNDLHEYCLFYFKRD